MVTELITTAAWERAGRDGRSLRHRAERGEWERIHSGVFVDPAEWRDADEDDRMRARIRAVAARARRPPVFSHESAALLLDVPRIGRGPTEVETAIAPPTGARRTSGIRRRALALEPEDVIVVDGVQCTSLSRTLLDLTATRTFASAIVGGDRLLAQGADTDAALALLARTPTMRGAGRARTALGLIEPGVLWPIESLSRASMRLAGLPAPILQQPFWDEQGLIGIADFWWPALRLIGEADGKHKYIDPQYMNGRSTQQVLYDEKLREDRLRAVSSAFRRWDWNTALSPRLLAAKLATAGLFPE